MKSKLVILFLVVILVIFSRYLYHEVEFSEAEKLEPPAPVSTERTIIEETISENADTGRTVITPEEPLFEEPLPLVSIQDVWEEFGIKVTGEVWDQPDYKGKKIEDYSITPDELLLVYNVLSSLPQRLLKELEGITIVYQPTPGAVGFYPLGEKRVIIFGTPDRPGASYTGRNRFISVFYHEIGHHIDNSLLSPQERADFYQLYN